MDKSDAFQIAINVLNAAGRDDAAQVLLELVDDYIRSHEKAVLLDLMVRLPGGMKDGAVFASVYEHKPGTIPFSRPLAGDDLLETLRDARDQKEV